MANEDAANSGHRILTFKDQDSREAAEIFLEAKQAANWSEEALREAVRMPGVSAWVSARAGTISGIVVGRRVLDEAEILNLAVRLQFRRTGVGRELVRRLLEEFAGQGVSRVFLEVRESNAGALAFYERIGFRVVGTRKDYYQAPAEAATVMELWLQKSTD
jgi:[ribosomal protein S18]-alanine N-acetyltransferase